MLFQPSGDSMKKVSVVVIILVKKFSLLIKIETASSVSPFSYETKKNCWLLCKTERKPENEIK